MKANLYKQFQYFQEVRPRERQKYFRGYRSCLGSNKSISLKIVLHTLILEAFLVQQNKLTNNFYHQQKNNMTHTEEPQFAISY